MNITKEQIKKFWEYCGFKMCNGYWYMPTKDNEIDYYMPELEPISLDNIYEYAISKLQDKGYFIELTAYEHKGYKCLIKSIINTDSVAAYSDNNPVECLFNAIYEVIEYENK
jgi:Zn/Cd-binding protein ZinT